MTTAIEKETDMSNDNEIYPLPRCKEVEDTDEHGSYGRTVERSVNARLAPIFRALLDDPDGWECQAKHYRSGWETSADTSLWWAALFQASPEGLSEKFRLVRKRRTIPVEIPMPAHVCSVTTANGEVVICYSQDFRLAKEAGEAIRKAMEGSDG